MRKIESFHDLWVGIDAKNRFFGREVPISDLAVKTARNEICEHYWRFSHAIYAIGVSGKISHEGLCKNFVHFCRNEGPLVLPGALKLMVPGVGRALNLKNVKFGLALMLLFRPCDNVNSHHFMFWIFVIKICVKLVNSRNIYKNFFYKTKISQDLASINKTPTKMFSSESQKNVPLFTHSYRKISL